MKVQWYPFYRSFSTSLSVKSQTTRQYYFVDTNIIVSYLEEHYKEMRNFIENENRKFFYTETVKMELEKSKMDFSNSQNYFKYVPSGLTEGRKEAALHLLKKLCSNHFTQNHNPLLSLTEKQIKNFHNDLFIIFESGYARYNELPEYVYSAELLTYNLKLYKKFLKDTEKQEIMEQTINLMGFEHLIDVKLLNEVISVEDVIKKKQKPII